MRVLEVGRLLHRDIALTFPWPMIGSRRHVACTALVQVTVSVASLGLGLVWR